MLGREDETSSDCQAEPRQVEPSNVIPQGPKYNIYIYGIDMIYIIYGVYIYTPHILILCLLYMHMVHMYIWSIYIHTWCVYKYVWYKQTVENSVYK